MRSLAFLSKLVIALLSVAAVAAHAQEIEVRDASLHAAEEGVVLDADFAFDFNSQLAEVVSNGVPLYFDVEFELTRPRWYWFDEKTLSKRMQVRLSYHALSRHYRLSTGVLQQNFDSLDDALRVLRRVRNWLVIDRGSTLADGVYEAAVRMKLDVDLLPKPLQVSALTNRDWHLESPWKRFSFRPPQQAPAPVESRQPTEAPQ